jgi:hypothetical protein
LARQNCQGLIMSIHTIIKLIKYIWIIKHHWDQLCFHEHKGKDLRGLEELTIEGELRGVHQPVTKCHFPWVTWFSFYSNVLELIVKFFVCVLIFFFILGNSFFVQWIIPIICF